MQAELLVVGTGPAGLSAALAAADAGVAVTLVDGNATLGGQYYRQRAGRPATLPARLARAVDHPGIRVVLGCWIWAADGLTFRLDDRRSIRAGAVVLAPGATELCYPIPGWELPGVVTAGAAQALLKGQGVAIGERVLVAGSGPFLLPVAAGLVQAGVGLVGVCEATRIRAVGRPMAAAVGHRRKLAEAGGYLQTLLRAGIRPRTGHVVTACSGVERVRSATICRVDHDWVPVPGSARSVAVDAVCVSYGFVPALELPRALGVREVAGATWHDDRQATDVPGVFVAGEACGIGGYRLAEAEGTVAGLFAAQRLGRRIDRRVVGSTRSVIARERRFAALLDRLYPKRAGWLRWLTPETVFCRCEESTWADVEAALAGGAADVRAVKALSRCGMGYCQGRVCGPPLVAAVRSRTACQAVGDLARRTIATPVALGDLAE